MKIKKIATSFTIGAFCLTGLTGILILLELTDGGGRAVHEWAGVLFVIAGIVHAVTHRKMLMTYFRSGFACIIGLVILAGLITYAISYNDIYASGASFRKLTSASLEDLAPVLSMEKNALVVLIEKRGVRVGHTGQSVRDIARENDTDVYEIIEPLLK